MAGSLSHIVGPGGFRMTLVENLGDAYEALEECYDILAWIADGDADKVNEACQALGFPSIKHDPIVGQRESESDSDG